MKRRLAIQQKDVHIRGRAPLKCDHPVGLTALKRGVM